MKITRKNNHDSLWLKASQGKVWAKLFIGRSRQSVSCNGPSMELIADKMWANFNKRQASKLTRLNYGEILDDIAADLRDELEQESIAVTEVG